MRRLNHEVHEGSRMARKVFVTFAPLRLFRVSTYLTWQRRIVAYLDDLQSQVDELTAAQDATQAELEALLPSVLDQAFRGELWEG